MRKVLLFPLSILFFVLPCSAQTCSVDSAEPNDTFAYMRSEVKSLAVIREAINLSAKMKTVPLPGDPNHQQAMVDYHLSMQSIHEHFACAARLLQPYKASANENVKQSVDNLLTAIQSTEQVDSMLRGMVEQINAPERDQHATDTAEKLAEIKSAQHVIFKMMLGGVKESTFGIVRGNGADEGWKPTAFTITRRQHDALLSDVRALAEAKTEHANYVDLCAEILLETLTEPLPLTGEVAQKR